MFVADILREIQPVNQEGLSPRPWNRVLMSKSWESHWNVCRLRVDTADQPWGVSSKQSNWVVFGKRKIKREKLVFLFWPIWIKTRISELVSQKIYSQSKAAANPSELTHQWFRLQDLLEHFVAPAQKTTHLRAPGKAEPKARMVNSVQGSPQCCCNRSHCIQWGHLWSTEDTGVPP